MMEIGRVWKNALVKRDGVIVFHDFPDIVEIWWASWLSWFEGFAWDAYVFFQW